jgi:hypothetical protein
MPIAVITFRPPRNGQVNAEAFAFQLGDGAIEHPQKQGDIPFGNEIVRVMAAILNGLEKPTKVQTVLAIKGALLSESLEGGGDGRLTLIGMQDANLCDGKAAHEQGI